MFNSFALLHFFLKHRFWSEARRRVELSTTQTMAAETARIKGIRQEGCHSLEPALHWQCPEISQTQPSDNYRRSHWHPSCSSFARPFSCLPCHNLVFLLEGTDSQKVKEEVRSPTDPFQHVLELSTHCCPRKHSGEPRACLLGCSVRAQAARKCTHRINARAQLHSSIPIRFQVYFRAHLPQIIQIWKKPPATFSYASSEDICNKANIQINY